MNRSKLMLLVWASIALAATAWSQADADVNVRGHYRRNGSYVRPHMRSNPDGNSWNNWSTLGNRNKYTGQLGTRVPRSSATPDWAANPQPGFSPRSNATRVPMPQRGPRSYENDPAEVAPDQLTPAEQARIEAETKARLVESLYKSAVAAEERAWEEADRRALNADEERARAAAAERRAPWEREEVALQASARAQMVAKMAEVTAARTQRRRVLEAQARRDAQARLRSELQRQSQILDKAEAAAVAQDLEKIECQKSFAKRHRESVLKMHNVQGPSDHLAKNWARIDQRSRMTNELRLAENAEARAEKRNKAIASFQQQVVNRLKADLAAYSRALDVQERQTLADAEAELAADVRARKAEFERSEAVILARERSEVAANAARRAASRWSAGQSASAAADEEAQTLSWAGWALGLLGSGIAVARGLGRFVG